MITWLGVKSALRFSWLVVFGVAAACGIDAVGLRDVGPDGDGGSSGAASSGGSSGAASSSGGITDPDGGPQTDGGVTDGGVTDGGVTDGGGVDAPLDASCPDACNGGCGTGSCKINCTGSSQCNSKVVCPPGLPCEVSCKDNDSCLSGVDCFAAPTCTIVCDNTGNGSDPGACSNVRCSGAKCSVTCKGGSVCQGSLQCDASICEFGCVGGNSCCNTPSCAAGSTCRIDASSGAIGGC